MLEIDAYNKDIEVGQITIAQTHCINPNEITRIKENLIQMLRSTSGEYILSAHNDIVTLKLCDYPDVGQTRTHNYYKSAVGNHWVYFRFSSEEEIIGSNMSMVRILTTMMTYVTNIKDFELLYKLSN